MQNTLNFIFSYPKVICNFSFGFKIFYPNYPILPGNLNLYFLIE